MSTYYQKIFSLFTNYQHFGKELALSSLYRGLVVLINFSTGFIISRDLMETNRGLFQFYLTTLILSFTFFSLGMNTSGMYIAGKETDKLNKFLSFFIVINIITTLIIAMLAIAGGNYFHTTSTDLEQLFAISYFCFSLSTIFKNILIGLGKNVWLQKTEFLLRLFYLGFILYLHFSHTMSVFLIMLFITVEYVALIFISMKKLNIKIFPLDIDMKYMRTIFRLNSKVYLFSILYIILLRGDQYIIKNYLSNYNLGLYSIGSSMVENLGLISTMFISIFIARLLKEDDFLINLEKTKKALIAVGGISLVLSFIVYFLSPSIIFLSFKTYHQSADYSFKILLIGFVFWSMFLVINSIYISLRYKKSLLFIMLASTIFNIGLNFYLTPKYGIEASAAISSVSYFLLFVMTYIDIFVLKKNNYIKKTKRSHAA